MNYLKRAIGRFPLLFLLLLALVPRLYNLGAPVIGVHSWRQADTGAIARNFYETMLANPGLSNLWRFAYPQVDWGGGGYAETEFPLYPALVSLLYRLFGPDEVWARGLSVVFSLVGLYFLYKLVELSFDRAVAFWSALFYAILPLSVFYGRTVQPESLVVMSGLGGIYFFRRWLGQGSGGVGSRGVGDGEWGSGGVGDGEWGSGEWGSWGDLVFSGLFVTTAVLLKVIPIVYLGLPLLFLAAVKFGFKLFLRWELWLYALGVLGGAAAWYFHAHTIFLDSGLTFGFWSGDTDRYTWASLLSLQYWVDILFRTMVRHFAVASFVVALVGLTFKRQRAEDWMWEVGLFGSFLAGAIAPASSYVHEYYQLPIMMFGVVFIGKVFARVFNFQKPAYGPTAFQKPAKWQKPALTVALVLTLLTGSVIYAIDYMKLERAEQSTVYALAELIQQNTPADAKLLVTTAGDPTLLYLSHRKGWMISPEEVSPERIEAAVGDGASFLAGSYEIVQSYAKFEDESQKETIRELISQGATPLVNNESSFIAPI